MSYQLHSAAGFERTLRRFLQTHPDLSGRVAQTLGDLENDPFQETLRTHPLHGELAGRHAVRLTYRYRVTIWIDRESRIVTLLDIGAHDDVYR